MAGQQPHTGAPGGVRGALLAVLGLVVGLAVAVVLIEASAVLTEG